MPPEGDPVKKYQEAKTKQERYDTISNFMALGHDKNPFMLIEALKDPDVSNRVFAVESASALTPEEATNVLRKAVINNTGMCARTYPGSAPCGKQGGRVR